MDDLLVRAHPLPRIRFATIAEERVAVVERIPGRSRARAPTLRNVVVRPDSDLDCQNAHERRDQGKQNGSSSASHDSRRTLTIEMGASTADAVSDATPSDRSPF